MCMHAFSLNLPNDNVSAGWHAVVAEHDAAMLYCCKQPMLSAGAHLGVHLRQRLQCSGSHSHCGEGQQWGVLP